MDEKTARLVATGVAGYAIAFATLGALARRGAIGANDIVDIMDHALASVEAVDGAVPSEISRLARGLLGDHLDAIRRPGTSS